MRFSSVVATLAGLLALFLSQNAGADAMVATGALPITAEALPVITDPSSELVIAGSNDTGAPLTLVLRIDDAASVDYPTRVNAERAVAPGAFELAFPIGGLTRSNGAKFDLAAARRIMLFSATHATISASIRLRPGFALPPGTIGLDLGPVDAPVFPGFNPLRPGDPRIVSGGAVGIQRGGGPPLINTGLVGGTVYRVPLANGRWRLTLWTEDPGEWETLPHPLNRRVRVNGVDALNRTWTPQGWVQERYLRLSRQEPQRMDSAWYAFGRYRGGRLDVPLTVTNGAAQIELAGDGAASTYLAAILAQPDDGSPSAADMVDAQRAKRFDADWPIFGPSDFTLPANPTVLAQGSAARIELRLPPGVEPVGLDYAGDPRIQAFEARWTLDRKDTGGNLLQPTANHLVPLGTPLARNAALPRRIVLWVTASPTTAPGVFGGVVLTRDGGRYPFSGEVLAARLPTSPFAAGAYLEPAPHLDWFDPTGATSEAQARCDLAVLAGFGLTTVAAPWPTPAGSTVDIYRDRLAALPALGFQSPFLAYATLKQLAASVPADQIPTRIATLSAILGPQAFGRVYWSVADEPSNAIQGTDLVALGKRLRAGGFGFKTAAHLNAPGDLADLSGFDLVLLDPGLPIDSAMIAGVRRRGVEPWLYNMGNPRLAAGFWGARSGAGGYAQWHARMPTADPFDPTDGREGDVQFLPPTAEVCGANPDVTNDLLRLAEGVVDARWLAWLNRADPANAAALLARLPDRWDDAKGLDDAASRVWRDAIINSARSLK